MLEIAIRNKYNTITIPSYGSKEQRLSKIKQLDQNHVASKLENWDLNLSSRGPKSQAPPITPHGAVKTGSSSRHRLSFPGSFLECRDASRSVLETNHGLVMDASFRDFSTPSLTLLNILYAN